MHHNATLLPRTCGGCQHSRRIGCLEQGLHELMSDRGLLFIFGVVVILVCLGSCAGLLMNGQAESVDGLFLILMCLAIALAFGLYLMFMIKRAMEPPPAPPKAAAKPATAAKPEPVAQTQAE